MAGGGLHRQRQQDHCQLALPVLTAIAAEAHAISLAAVCSTTAS
jgi:hypothetical protein